MSESDESRFRLITIEYTTQYVYIYYSLKEHSHRYCSDDITLTLYIVYTCVCRDVRQMLLKLVELRSSNWGRVLAASVSRDATPDNDPNYFMVCILKTPALVFNHWYVSWHVFFVFFECEVFTYDKCYAFAFQNEPTFYTTDGTPFTAADPGEPHQCL